MAKETLLDNAFTRTFTDPHTGTPTTVETGRVIFTSGTDGLRFDYRNSYSDSAPNGENVSNRIQGFIKQVSDLIVPIQDEYAGFDASGFEVCAQVQIQPIGYTAPVAGESDDRFDAVVAALDLDDKTPDGVLKLFKSSIDKATKEGTDAAKAEATTALKKAEDDAKALDEKLKTAEVTLAVLCQDLDLAEDASGEDISAAIRALKSAKTEPASKSK